MHSDGGVNFTQAVYSPNTIRKSQGLPESDRQLQLLKEKLMTEPKVIPFSTEDEGVDYPTIARRFVQTEINSMGVERIYLDQIYVVSFAYILGGWKAMVSTNLPDGKYYEVTHKPEHDGTDGPEATFVDTYIKVQNTKYSKE